MKRFAWFSLMGLVLAGGISVARAGDAVSPDKPAAPEDLGYDYFNGKTNRIARVYNVTPVAVQVIYEGDKGGRNIPRNNLPPALKAKYPYNADEADEFIKNRAGEVLARNLAQKTAWQQKLVELKAEIASLKKQMADNEAEIKLVIRQIRADRRNKTLKARRADLELQQDDLRNRRDTLENTLVTTQKAIDGLP